MRCKHNFVRSGYGNDLICTKCGYAAMQAVATLPIQELITRETVDIVINTGGNSGVISVHKDEREKELKRELGFDLTHNIMKNARRL